MTLRRGLSVLSATTIAIGLTAACGDGAPREAQPEAPPAPAAAESPVAVNEKWRAKHETDYRRDWVTIAGLHPLKPGINTAGSAPANDIVLPAGDTGDSGQVRAHRQGRPLRAGRQVPRSC